MVRFAALPEGFHGMSRIGMSRIGLFRVSRSVFIRPPPLYPWKKGGIRVPPFFRIGARRLAALLPPGSASI